MVLLGERVRLDELEPLDLDPFTQLHSAEEVTRFLSPPRPLTASESFRLFCQVLGHAQVKGFGYWAVRRLTDDVWLGLVGLWCPEGWPGVELGWRLAPEFWGRGFAREAALLARDFAQRELGLGELLSIIHTDNVRSLRLARRLEMIHCKDLTIGDAPVSVFHWCATSDGESSKSPAG